jgi:hypothetical protein
MTASEFIEYNVESHLRGDVQKVNLSERELVDHHRSHGVEDDLESAEESLPKDRI